MAEEDRGREQRPLSTAEKINLFIGLLSTFIALVSGVTNIPAYWKLGIAAFAVVIGAIFIFLSREAWRRMYISLGPLIAGAAVGLIVGVFVISVGGHPRWASTPTPGPPPSASTVTILMNEEVAATLDHDIISQIYAPNAFVEDGPCRPPPGGIRTWTGLDQIMARYQGLNRFASLRHVNAKVVQWQPDNSLADQATVTAQTAGDMESGGGSLQSLSGNEVWHFARLPDGRWVITSFNYHACSPLS